MSPRDKDGQSLMCAPCVIQTQVPGTGETVLLGPCFTMLALSTPLTEIDGLDADTVAMLCADQILVPSTAHEQVAGESMGPADGPAPDIYIFAPQASGYGWQLARALAPWRKASVLTSLDSLRSLSIEQRPTIIFLDHFEPGDPLQSVRPLLEWANVLWFGETEEGPHAGPLFHTYDDVALYADASAQWSSVAMREAHGFGTHWPLSITLRLVTDPEAVARGVLHVLEAPAGHCFLIDQAQKVIPWTCMRHQPFGPSSVPNAHTWSKGFVRQLAVDTLEDFPTVHLATCLTPHDRIDYLEVNGGKGLSSEKAQITVVGEAVERLAAWEANRRIQHDGPKIIKEDARTFHLQDFHPFGPPWEIYLAHQQPKLPMVEVLDEITGGRCAVPECLVPFSYAPNNPSLIATACDSEGLAAYPT